MFNFSHTWQTPGGAYKSYIPRALDSHLLIGGTTGAGKSVLIDNIISYLLTVGISQFVLIDPKEVQLARYTHTPHAIVHATTPQGITDTLQRCAELMDSRFSEMRRRGQTETTEKHFYIIIDEWIDIKILCEKSAVDALTRIIAKGRAAHIHVILATQRPTREMLPGTIRANFPDVIALRCANSQESRNLIGATGAEQLPKHGYAILSDPNGTEYIPIDYKPDRVAYLLEYWKQQLDAVPRWKWKRCREC